MLMLNSLAGFSADMGSKAFTYKDVAIDATNATIYTFSGVAIGTADSNRSVIAVVGGTNGAGATLSSATIGGVSATILVQKTQDDGGGNSAVVAIIIATVPTGTTADIVATFSSGLARAGAAWWTATGLISNASVDTDSVANTDPATATLNTVLDGFCIAGVVQLAVSGSCTWSNVTERFDSAMEATSGLITGGDASTTGANISPSGDLATAGTSVAVFATF